MRRISWVLGFVPAALCLVLAGLPQPAARAADATPPTGTIVINNNRSATNTPNVTLALTWNDGVGGSGVSRMRFSDDGSHWTAWEAPAATRAHTLPAGDGHKTVRVQYLDKANNRSAVYSDYILLDRTPPTGSIVINNGALTTPSRSVTLGLTWSDGSGTGVTRMRFSDNGSSWTVWEPQKTTRAYALPAGLGYHTVRVQYLDGANNYSAVFNDYINIVPPTVEMVSVPGGTFTMGNSGVGDDAYGASNELPRHSVTLSAYEIGKCLVTNEQYCDVLNWALMQGRLKTPTGADWAGKGDIWAGGNLQMILQITDAVCNIQYSDGVFSPKTRMGLPGTTNYSMGTHPAENVSWYGAVAFCTWLSQMEGLEPCYDITSADWPLTAAPPAPGGYRLPTEAEWERAAAWDGTKHWIYGFTSDTLTGNARNNYTSGGGASVDDFVNPLGLSAQPYTSPVGWFNGVNVSPNGNVATVNSVSPVGAYDMSGNVMQWCGDWFDSYGSGAQVNPTGPTGSSASNSGRVARGGAWYDSHQYCRSALRLKLPAETASSGVFGFRLAKS